jgi:hypothetical protein
MGSMVEESKYLPIPLRPIPPDLEFPPPDCSVCGGDLEYDDWWYCNTCEISWPSDGRARRYGQMDPASAACLSTIEPLNRDSLGAKHENLRHLREQCVLPAGHEGKHRGGVFTEWDHGDPRIVHHSIEDAEYLGVTLTGESLFEDGDDD